jgi:hypothetical protein
MTLSIFSNQHFKNSSGRHQEKNSIFFLCLFILEQFILHHPDDVMGKIMEVSENHSQINISDFPEGIYLLELVTDDNFISKN